MKLAASILVLAPVVALIPGSPVRGQDTKPTFSPEQIEQLVAPIALHPDDLVSQILMASTYPLEVVQAKRWVDANKSLKGDAQAKALEKKEWDPSVKSLVNFPDVLAMMDGKLDWVQDLGNAFLSQKKDVMDAIQRLRKKAMDEGNLKASKEVNVTTEADTIVIVSTDPEVIYVPVYNPTIVYGAWPYPSYPPYYYYPPYWRPVATPYAFAAGVAVGAAWGYAWGRCDWGHYDVDVDINRNVNRNTNINRDQYRNQMQNRGMTDGRGTWQHDASHRRGVGYGDARTAQQYGRGASPTASSREAYRGRTGSEPSRGAAPSTRDAGAGQRPHTRQPTAQPSRSSGGAFGGYTSGSQARQQSSRGQASRQSYSRSTGRSSGASRGGGSRGGGGRR